MSDSVKARPEQAGQPAQQEEQSKKARAQEAAGEVAGTARDQAKEVTGEARRQARAATKDMRGRFAEEAEAQAHRTAGSLRQWGDDLAGLADNAPEASPARGLVEQVADSSHRAADYLDRRGPDGMVRDVQDFARRRPVAFLGTAVLAGFAVGRLAKANRASGDGASGGEARDPDRLRASGPERGPGPSVDAGGTAERPRALPEREAGMPPGTESARYDVSGRTPREV